MSCKASEGDLALTTATASCLEGLAHSLGATATSLCSASVEARKTANTGRQNASDGIKKMEPPRSKNFAVLLVSHGSPSAEWNASQIALRDQVAKKLSPTVRVKWAWLEFAEPDIKQAMDELEAESGGDRIDHVIAVPVFISVSSHSERDIPNCLNIRYTPLRDDDLRRYCGNLPVTYCSPMDHGNVLPEILLDSCRKTFKDKLGLEVVPEATTSTTSSSTLSQTAVITVSHGDGCEHFWGHLHARIAEKIDADFPGLAVNTWCYVQTLRKPFVQQRFADLITDCIEKHRCKNVIVLSCFNGTGGQMFLERLETMYFPYLENVASFMQKYPAGNRDGVLIAGDDPWMGDPRIADWCAEMALGCIKCMGMGVDEEKVADGGAGAGGNIKMEVEQEVGGEDDINEDEQPPYNPPFWLTRDRKADKGAMMAPPLKTSKGKAKGGKKGDAGGKEKGASGAGKDKGGTKDNEKGKAACPAASSGAAGGAVAEAGVGLGAAGGTAKGSAKGAK